MLNSIFQFFTYSFKLPNPTSALRLCIAAATIIALSQFLKFKKYYVSLNFKTLNLASQCWYQLPKNKMTKKLILPFNKKFLEVELSETEIDKLSAISTFLDKEATEWKIEKSFFDKSSAVPDIFRYVLKFTSTSGWLFFDTNEKKVDKFEIDNDQKEIPTEDSKNIVLILESPHKDEYEINDDKLIPRSPASGDTGKAIYYFFTSHVLPILNSLGLELNNLKKYNFCIMNPVPYQTSLVNIHKEGLISSLRDKVWKTMYLELKDDFKSRLEGYKPFVILNGCTSNLKDKLIPEIKQIKNSKVFNVNHPASWQRTLSGFKIQK